MIKEHFPKANAVAIISNPSLFLKDVENSIGEKVLYEKYTILKLTKVMKETLIKKCKWIMII